MIISFRGIRRFICKALWHVYAWLALFLLYTAVSVEIQYDNQMLVIARAQARALILMADSIMGGLKT